MAEKKPELMHKLEVVRNTGGNEVKVSIDLFETFIKRNPDKKDVVYPSPPKDFVREHFDDIVTWFGQKRVASIIASRIKQLCQGWYEEAGGADESGKPTPENFNLEKFLQLATAVDSRGESKAELEEEKAELMEELLLLLEAEDITTNIVRISEIKARTKEINEALEAKKRAPRSNTTEAAGDLKPSADVPAQAAA